jgi:hypothetical protein
MLHKKGKLKSLLTVSYLAMELICKNEDKRGIESIFMLAQNHS